MCTQIYIIRTVKIVTQQSAGRSAMEGTVLVHQNMAAERRYKHQIHVMTSSYPSSLGWLGVRHKTMAG